MIAIVKEKGQALGIAASCSAVGLSRATFYRRISSKTPAAQKPRKGSIRQLSNEERKTVLDVLHEDRFVDLAPPEVYAQLLDDKQYLCSIRTMYRILAENQEIRERRRQSLRPAYKKPELLATGPNQVWSWDITKLMGPAKWTYYYLYVLIDIFSRYVVGWLIAERESAGLAKRLISETCDRQGISPGSLVIHSDRGAPMISKTLAQTLGNLGVTKSHSRPYVSDDNPFSEAQFKTLKYRPDFPERFGSLKAGEMHCRDFFYWYNHEHHHSGIALMTPYDIHSGIAQEKWDSRAQTLSAAHLRHPERFQKGIPRPQPLPKAVWINRPQDETAHAARTEKRAHPIGAQVCVAHAETTRPTAAGIGGF